MPVQIDVINLDDELADKEITQDHSSKLDDDIFDKHYYGSNRDSLD
jgi:hypothetical protein